ncbi:MAG: hypothetical protein OXT01_30415, partial [Rhodospirillaceae bacterium]|nr:hypothetical protein [Rhodospirillaceae bacterium]
NFILPPFLLSATAPAYRSKRAALARSLGSKRDREHANGHLFNMRRLINRTPKFGSDFMQDGDKSLKSI